MPIRAVVFDIGGVLEHNPPTGWQERWEARLHLGPGVLERKLADVYQAAALGRVTEAAAEQRIGEIVGLDRAQLDDLMADIWDEYLGSPNAGLTDYFVGLRPRYRTGILSNSAVGAREREYARYRFADLCDVVIYSHEEGMEKPDPRFFALAWSRLGVEPHEMVFLDDVEGHVAAARALGIHAVHFTETARAISDIDALLGADSTR